MMPRTDSPLTPINDPFATIRDCPVEDLRKELAKLGFCVEERSRPGWSSVRVSRGSLDGKGEACCFVEALDRAKNDFLARLAK